MQVGHCVADLHRSDRERRWPIGHEEQHAEARDAVDEVAQQVHARGVGPLHVLEQPHERGLNGCRLEQVAKFA